MRDLAIRPRTLAPPPLVYAAGLLAAWWLDARLPLPFEASSARPLGWALVGIGLTGFIWALAAIWSHRTTVNPYKAASNLVTEGPFRFSRNPIYLSDWFVYAGVATLLGTLWALALAPLVWAVMRFGIIRHEEAHLEARFGDEYRRYRARVRRWL